MPVVDKVARQPGIIAYRDSGWGGMVGMMYRLISVIEARSSRVYKTDMIFGKWV